MNCPECGNSVFMSSQLWYCAKRGCTWTSSYIPWLDRVKDILHQINGEVWSWETLDFMWHELCHNLHENRSNVLAGAKVLAKEMVA